MEDQHRPIDVGLDRAITQGARGVQRQRAATHRQALVAHGMHRLPVRGAFVDGAGQRQQAHQLFAALTCGVRAQQRTLAEEAERLLLDIFLEGSRPPGRQKHREEWLSEPVLRRLEQFVHFDDSE